MKTKLKYWRTKRGMSADTLHQISKVARTSITNFENGYAMPHPKTSARLIEALDIRIEQLFTDDNDPEADGPHSVEPQNRVA